MSTNYAHIADEPSFAKSPSTTSSHPRLRRYGLYCGCSAAVLAVFALIVTLVVLSYKLRSPRITIDSIAVSPVRLDRGSPADKLTVATHFSIRNRDREYFKFDGIRTSLSYRGKDIGSAQLSAGKVKARKTFRGNMTVNAIADRILDDPNWIRDLQIGSIGIDSVTRSAGGRIRTWYRRKGIWRWYNRHIDVSIKCNVTISVPNVAVLSRVCS